MEKYSQYRDKGSGIAPFFAVATQPSGVALPFHAFLFMFRSFMLFCTSLTYLALSWLVLPWLPYGSVVEKVALWCLIGIPGIWWIDLQLDGVKKGSLARQPPNRLPHPGTIIASSFTSPVDCLYLAVVFNPIFTASYPKTRRIERLSLLQAFFRAFATPLLEPPKGAKLTTVSALLRQHPDSIIAVLPECTTTNGRGILPFSPSILTVPPKTCIFPISIRYSAPDITTPIPHTYLSFLWNLCSRPTHCIRVRIAECMYNTSADTALRPKAARQPKNSYETNYFDGLELRSSSPAFASSGDEEDRDDAEANVEEQQVLDQIGETLARLGRVKRVNLSVKDKAQFITSWSKKGKSW